MKRGLVKGKQDGGRGKPRDGENGKTSEIVKGRGGDAAGNPTSSTTYYLSLSEENLSCESVRL